MSTEQVVEQQQHQLYIAEQTCSAVQLVLLYINAQHHTQMVTEEKWVEMQQEDPLCVSLPILRVSDSKTLCYTRTICRYLANQNSDLMPTCPVERLECDVLVNDVHLIDRQWRQWMHADEQQKSDAWYNLQHNHLIPFFTKIDSQLADRDETSFLFGPSLTWADLYVFAVLHSWTKEQPSLIEGYEQIESFMQRISQIQRLQSFFSGESAENLQEANETQVEEPTAQEVQEPEHEAAPSAGHEELETVPTEPTKTEDETSPDIEQDSATELVNIGDSIKMAAALATKLV